MKVALTNYTGEKKEVTIPDFNNIERIICRILSGDMTLEIKYKDNTFLIIDPEKENRQIDCFDGEVDIPLDKINEISNINHSYNTLQIFKREIREN